MKDIYKYPRTYHIQGSGFNNNRDKIPFEKIANRKLAIEEKMDGANVAISFDRQGKILLQSRGHYLVGGVREKHFNLFKQWVYTIADKLFLLLKDRYIMYGEWLYAKHTVFYNYLTHYFMEYDILDLANKEFLDTPRRCKLLQNLPIISVPVLYSGKIKQYKKLVDLVGQSNFIHNNHLETLQNLCLEKNKISDRAIQQTDNSNLMEGLYIKVEEDGIVRERYKYIRSNFLATIKNSNTHWLDRPIIPNQLQPNINLFSE